MQIAISWKKKDKVNMPFYTYNQSSNKLTLLVEVQGTQYEGRNSRIENIKISDKVIIKLDYFGLDNLYDEVIYARKHMKLEKVKDYSYEKIYESDNFVEYMKTIIQKEKNRYGILEKYIPNDKFLEDDFYSLKDIIYEYALYEKKYYWFEQCRVNKTEFEQYTGYKFNHWYEIAELYKSDSNLPFDLGDEDIVSIFGFEKFEDFGDLSYGC